MKYVIELTDIERQQLANLIDAGVRAGGLQTVKVAALMLDRLEQAQPIEEIAEE